MEKRYQVFVSSTFEDLKEERQEVMQALLELDCMPAGMELFPAADEDQWTLIKRVIDDCDYYIVVVAGSYGSIGPEGISYTRMEYEYAVKQSKPVIGFVHKDPGQLPAIMSEKDPERIKKLDDFRDLLKQKMVKYWGTPKDLGSAVSRSLVRLIKDHPAVGWVKDDLLPDKNATEEMLAFRKKIDILEGELLELRSQMPYKVDDLSQGDDLVELRFSFKAIDYSVYKVIISKFETTWNELFSRISPLLLDECKDNIIHDNLNIFIRERNIFDIVNIKYPGLSDHGEFKLIADDYYTIKVQFLALGLIVKADRSIDARHGEAYWRLTPHGEKVMMELRAIKRPTS